MDLLNAVCSTPIKGQEAYEVDYTLKGLVFIFVINRKFSKGLLFRGNPRDLKFVVYKT